MMRSNQANKSSISILLVVRRSRTKRFATHYKLLMRSSNTKHAPPTVQYIPVLLMRSNHTKNASVLSAYSWYGAITRNSSLFLMRGNYTKRLFTRYSLLLMRSNHTNRVISQNENTSNHLKNTWLLRTQYDTAVRYTGEKRAPQFLFFFSVGQNCFLGREFRNQILTLRNIAKQKATPRTDEMNHIDHTDPCHIMI